jgi:hypothetical protein
LTVVAEQDAWFAVSTQTGIAGWVLRSRVSEVVTSEAEGTDEVLPPKPEVDQPPAIEEGTEPEEPAPSVRVETVSIREEPSHMQLLDEDRGPGGFYDMRKWWGISVGSRDDTILPGATVGLMVHRMVAVSLLGLAGYSDTSFGTIYSGGGGGAVDVFILQPNERLPIGVYGGGRITYEHSFNDDFESLAGVMTIAGEAGGYAHFGNKVMAIPRAAVRVAQNSVYVDGSKTGDDTETLFVAGLDLRFGSIVPGVHVTIFDGGEIFAGSLIVAF